MSDRPSRPRQLSGALRDASGPAAGVYARADRLRRQEAWLFEVLPTQARNHVRLAGITAEELRLVVDSPEWRHRVRYIGPHLQEVVAKHSGTRPRRVTVKVGDLPRRPERVTPRRLSKTASDTLRSAASGIEDERLAEALSRLASRRDDGNAD